MMKVNTYKVVDLFGNEELRFADADNTRPNLFSNYEGFLEKFEEKKTTDDCYTPTDVYNVILDYVAEKVDLTGKEIIRPFYPGGDYESINYPDNAVVIDNPPFSIISKIARFYVSKEIQFFLFAPHLTLFSIRADCTHIVVGGDITYENAATIKTSFITNMLGDIKILGDADLLNKFKKMASNNKVNLPKYEYPPNVITVSQVAYMIERGVSLEIKKQEAKHIGALEDQKKHKKTIFGGGYLISDPAAAQKEAAQKEAAQKENVIIWELSEKEKTIIQNLGKVCPCK